jgi:hypothetical protein
VVAISPSLIVIQGLQVVRRVAQYAIARPTREICFTVVEQSSRYKAKNVIDTVIYRFGDVSSAWMQAGIARRRIRPRRCAGAGHRRLHRLGRGGTLCRPTLRGDSRGSNDMSARVARAGRILGRRYRSNKPLPPPT